MLPAPNPLCIGVPARLDHRLGPACRRGHVRGNKAIAASTAFRYAACLEHHVPEVGGGCISCCSEALNSMLLRHALVVWLAAGHADRRARARQGAARGPGCAGMLQQLLLLPLLQGGLHVSVHFHHGRCHLLHRMPTWSLWSFL